MVAKGQAGATAEEHARRPKRLGGLKKRDFRRLTRACVRWMRMCGGAVATKMIKAEENMCEEAEQRLPMIAPGMRKSVGVRGRRQRNYGGEQGAEESCIRRLMAWAAALLCARSGVKPRVPPTFGRYGGIEIWCRHGP